MDMSVCEWVYADLCCEAISVVGKSINVQYKCS